MKHAELFLNEDYVRKSHEERMEWLATEAWRREKLANEADELYGRLIDLKIEEDDRMTMEARRTGQFVYDDNKYWRLSRLARAAWTRRERRYKRVIG